MCRMKNVRKILLGVLMSFLCLGQTWAKTAAELQKEIDDIKNGKTGLAQTMTQAGNLLNNAANGIDNVIQELKRRGVSEADIQKVVNTVGIDPRSIANDMRGVAKDLPTNYDGFKRCRTTLQNQINTLNDSKMRIEKEAEKERNFVQKIDVEIAEVEKSKREREDKYKLNADILQDLFDRCFHNKRNNGFDQTAACVAYPLAFPFHSGLMGVYKTGIEMDNANLSIKRGLRFIPNLIVEVNNSKTQPYRFGMDVLQSQIDTIDRATRDIDQQIEQKKKDYLCKDRDRGSTGFGWLGEYFNNKNLSGPPQMIKKESFLGATKDWKTEAPKGNNFEYSVNPVTGSDTVECGMNADNWSARWQDTITSNGGIYKFTTTADDGVRLWVNGQKIIDDWHDHPPTTNTATIPLPEGTLPIKVEFYDSLYGAMINVDWESLPGCATVRSGYMPLDHWKGEYFANKDLQGGPSMIRDDGTGFLNFDWGNNSSNPTCLLPVDNWSTRWTRRVSFENKTYRFKVTTDDGMRLYVDGVLKIDQWKIQAPTNYFVDVPMTTGYHTIKVEYYDGGWGATAKLDWRAIATPTPPPAVTPTPPPAPPVAAPAPSPVRPPVAPAPRPPRRGERRIQSGSAEGMVPLPPPPAPSEIQNSGTSPTKLPQEKPTPKSSPQEEAAPPKCEHGTWSPTFKRCIEDQVKEEAPPPDCGTGAHWSPTLKSCQQD